MALNISHFHLNVVLTCYILPILIYNLNKINKIMNQNVDNDKREIFLNLHFNL